MSGPRADPIGPAALVGANVAGLLLSALLFVGLAMGERQPGHARLRRRQEI